MDLIPLGVMGLNDAKLFQKKLKDQGIDLVLNHNEASCTRGCAVTVELLAKQTDLPTIQAAYQAEFEKSLQGHEVNFKQISEVFDPGADKVTCPACGHEFKPDGNECPDCGLMF